MTFANQQIIYALILFVVLALGPYLWLSLKGFQSKYLMKGAKISRKALRGELIASMLSFVVLYLCLLLGDYLRSIGIMKLHHLQELPRWYVYLSIPLIVFVHDAYFYWTHRLMHEMKFLYRFHRHHHLSHDPTSLSVFSFHPVEALIHFIFFVLYPLLIPTSLEILQFMYVFMFICNAAGHLPLEYYPKFLYDYPIIRQFNAATHHYMHHKYFNSNYGLYYNWWDRWFKTNHPEYFATYARNTAHQSESLSNPSIHLSRHSLASSGERVSKG